MEMNPTVKPFAALTERSRLAQQKWAARPVSERLTYIRRLRDLLLAEYPHLCAAVEKDLGRDPVQTLPGEIFGIAAAAKFLEKRAVRILRPRKVGGTPIWLFGQKNVVHRRPRGLVGIIGTWNYPLYLNAVQIMQALTAGNAVLWKPSEVAPHSAAALAEWIEKANLPEGLFVKLPATREAGIQLADADLDHVVFTGHAATGRKLAAHLGERLISSTLELSGCDAQFVLDDADVELAAKAAWFGCTLNSGQTCIAVRRAFVPRPKYPEFLQVLEPLAAAAQPLPLAMANQAARAEELIADALAKGARRLGDATVLSGDKRYRPVVLADVRPEMAVCHQDSFAPIMAVLPYDRLEDAIAASQQCEYELGVSVFTSDPKRAAALAEQLHAGMCTINDVIAPTAHPATPFGGRRASGWGSTQGEEGLLELTVPQVVTVVPGKFRPHYLTPGSSPLMSLKFFESMYRMAYAPRWTQRVGGFFGVLATAIGLRK
jgi:acyl-CoA reductase-like NAD-dependent aldehyde dehydrogenase